MLDFLLKRLKEPSTMAGLSVIGLLFGLPPGTVEIVGQCVGAVAGVAAILIPEKK